MISDGIGGSRGTGLTELRWDNLLAVIPVLLMCGFAVSCDAPESRTSEAAGPGRGFSTQELLADMEKVERPHILLIVVDTLRRDRLGCYGHTRNTSPNIDALARTAIRFDNAFSQAPWTTPSVAALLSSRYPSDLLIQEQPHALRDEVILLSEVLKDHGYATGAVVSHSYVGKDWNFDQGYDYFDDSNVKGHAETVSQGVSDSAIAFMEKSLSKKPTFLFAHYFDPHYNYLDHPEYDYTTELDYTGWVESGMAFKVLKARIGELEDPDREYLLALYDEEIAFTDHHIGRVLDKLRDMQAFEDTLIVVASDHGEEFLDHQSLGHAYTLFEEQIHVPLIVKFPKASRGGVSQELVQLIDVYPSILGYLGLEITHSVSGRAIQNQGLRPAFSETSRLAAEVRALVQDGHKLIWKVNDDEYMLYDLSSDPGEQLDLKEERKRRFRAMRDSLLERFDALEKLAAAHREKAREATISEQELRRLEALGYAR
jgi:choline-sulfatase